MLNTFNVFKNISPETIKGAAILALAQAAAGSDEFGQIVFGGGFAGTGQAGFSGTATIDGTTNALTILTDTFGSLQPGSVLTMAGVPAGTSVSSQVYPLLAGETAGGSGRYVMSAISTAAHSAAAVTASSTSLLITAVSAGVLGDGAVVLNGAATGSPKVVEQLEPLLPGEVPGGIGRYILSSVQLWASGAVTTATSTALTDGDNFTQSSGSWTGNAEDYSNTDVTLTHSRRYWFKLLGASALTLGDASLLPIPAKPGKVTMMSIVGHGFVPGAIFAVGTEVLRVTAVRDTNTIDAYRGYAGSPLASHAQGASVLTIASYAGINLLTDLVVPVTALALATAGPEIALAMTALAGFNPKDYGNFGSGIVKQSTLSDGFTWEYVAATNRLFFHRPCRGTASGATTVLIGSSFANGAASEVLYGGVQVGQVKQTVESRVPTTAEIAQGYMDFAFSFPIKTLQVSGDLSATDGPATIGSTVTFSADFKHITLTNNGTNNFAATETVTVRVTG